MNRSLTVISSDQPILPIRVVIPLLGIFLIWCSGCGLSGKRISETMESWKGHHVSDLIASWGPPQQIVDDGRGGSIYVWKQHVSIPWTKGYSTEKGTITNYGGNTSYYRNRTTYTPPTNLEWDRTRMFWVNKRGIIYHWQWQGL